LTNGKKSRQSAPAMAKTTGKKKTAAGRPKGKKGMAADTGGAMDGVVSSSAIR
jgi:hypothetical protein